MRLIASGLEGGCNGCRNIVLVAKSHGRLGVDHISTVTLVDVDERRNECPSLILVRSTVIIVRKPRYYEIAD